MANHRSIQTTGLLLIVVSFLFIFAAGYFVPPPQPCKTTACTNAENAAADVEFAALILLMVGVMVQAWNLARWRAEERIAPAPPAGGAGPSGFAPGVVPLGSTVPPLPPPPPGNLLPPRSVPPSTASTVHCPRCPGTYPVGQYAYCPACGSPLPFVP
jgi:hypothetical protein